MRGDRVSKPLLSGLALFGLCVGALRVLARSQDAPQSASRAWKVDFQKDIQPIFEKACYICHGPGTQMSGFRLDLKQAAFAGGASGKVIIPGKASDSSLYKRVAGIGGWRACRLAASHSRAPRLN